MRISRVAALYFSPTGNSERLAVYIGNAAAERLGVPFEAADFTPPDGRARAYRYGPGDLLIAAAPVYAGKLPNKILPDFRARLIGDGTPAAAVVTYGNRSFDNALAELVSVLDGNGFVPLAGAAFRCRHAFTDRLAPDHPGPDDFRQARAFAERLAALAADSDTEPAASAVPGTADGGTAADGVPDSTASAGRLAVPGDAGAPYYVPRGLDGQPARFLKAVPVTDAAKCTRCGLCARVCPTGCLSAEDCASVRGVCIKCHACIRRCPTGAKSFQDPAFLSHVRMLEANFTREQENAFFYRG